jgi:hypothetical protein
MRYGVEEQKEQVIAQIFTSINNHAGHTIYRDVLVTPQRISYVLVVEVTTKV